jgi:hypothetical protein
MDGSYDKDLEGTIRSVCVLEEGQERRTLCFFAILRTKLMTSKLAAESRPLVGSSRNIILGDVMSCCATLTLRFCPPLMPFLIGVPINAFSWFFSPNEAIRESMRSFLSDLVMVLYVGGQLCMYHLG